MHYKRNSWRLYGSILREHLLSEALKSNKRVFLFTAPHHRMSVTLYLQRARRSLINSSGPNFSAFNSHFPLYLLPVQLNIWRHLSVEVTVDKWLSWSYIYLTVIVKSCIKSVYSWKSLPHLYFYIFHTEVTFTETRFGCLWLSDFCQSVHWATQLMQTQDTQQSSVASCGTMLLCTLFKSCSGRLDRTHAHTHRWSKSLHSPASHGKLWDYIAICRFSSLMTLLINHFASHQEPF